MNTSMEAQGMVAFHDEHDHDDQSDELCPRCQFVESLVQYLDAAANGDDAQWHDATGEIINAMHSALWALHRLRAEATTDYSDEIDNHGEAARALATLGAMLARLDEELQG